jgi:hypothetical protein
MVALMASFNRIIDNLGVVNYFVQMPGKKIGRGKSVVLYFLEAEGEFLADIFNLMQADEMLKVRSGGYEVVDGNP